LTEYYEHIQLNSWKGFKEFIDKERSLNFIYRGQSDSAWELQTTIERANFGETTFDIEDELLKDFKKGLKFHLNNEITPNSTLEYHSLLQHYGAPSRLLDFTKSPYIAAYFAFEQATKTDGQEVAIWIVDRLNLYQSAFYYFEKHFSLTYDHDYNFDDQSFETVFYQSKEMELSCLFPVEPLNQNVRYHLQQSIFLALANPNMSLEEQLEFMRADLLHKTFKKVTIPATEKGVAIRDLIKMNINRATLFPGLDGFAKSLIVQYLNLKKLGE